MTSISLITISNAEKLGFKSRFELFDGSIAFKRVSEYTLSAVFANITNPHGQLLDFDEIEALKNTADYNYISVNGIILKRAKVKSFQLQEGIFFKDALITIVLEVQEEAEDLTELTGYYSDYASAFTSTCSFVDEISESINVSRGENSASFSKEVTIKFSNSMLLIGSDDPNVKQAQVFAKALFDYDEANGYGDTIPDQSAETSLRAILGAGFKKFTTESINTITNTCSFTQQVSAENIKNGGGVDYSHSATQSVSIAEEGIVTVREEGKIQPLTQFYDGHLANAETAYQYELTLAKARLYDIFNEYYECADGSPLNSDPDNNDSSKIAFLSISKNVDPYGGTISYTLTASNDPKYANAGDENPIFYSRMLTYSIDNGVWTATEKGTIESLLKKPYDGTKSGFERYPKFNGALTFYKTLNPTDLRTRVVDFMTEMGCALDKSPYPINRNETHSLLKGSIQYDRTFSTDKKFLDNDEYKSVTAGSSTDYEFKKKNEFTVLNHPIIIQPGAGVTRGSQQISSKVLGYRIPPIKASGVAALSQMYTTGAALISERKETETNFTENVSVSYNYINNVEMDLSATFARGMDEA